MANTKIKDKPRNRKITPERHSRLKAMAEAGSSARALLAEAGIQIKEISDRYDIRYGDVQYVLNRNVWPPRGAHSQNICRLICAELGLPLVMVWPGAPGG